MPVRVTVDVMTEVRDTLAVIVASGPNDTDDEALLETVTVVVPTAVPERVGGWLAS